MAMAHTMDVTKTMSMKPNEIPSILEDEEHHHDSEYPPHSAQTDATNESDLYDFDGPLPSTRTTKVINNNNDSNNNNNDHNESSIMEDNDASLIAEERGINDESQHLTDNNHTNHDNDNMNYDNFDETDNNNPLYDSMVSSPDIEQMMLFQQQQEQQEMMMVNYFQSLGFEEKMMGFLQSFDEKMQSMEKATNTLKILMEKAESLERIQNNRRISQLQQQSTTLQSAMSNASSLTHRMSNIVSNRLDQQQQQQSYSVASTDPWSVDNNHSHSNAEEDNHMSERNSFNEQIPSVASSITFLSHGRTAEVTQAAVAVVQSTSAEIVSQAMNNALSRQMQSYHQSSENSAVNVAARSIENSEVVSERLPVTAAAETTATVASATASIVGSGIATAATDQDSEQYRQLMDMKQHMINDHINMEKAFLDMQFNLEKITAELRQQKLDIAQLQDLPMFKSMSTLIYEQIMAD
jgi:hypothetical protein